MSCRRLINFNILTLLSVIVLSCRSGDATADKLSFSFPLYDLFSDSISTDFIVKKELLQEKVIFITNGDCSVCIEKIFLFNDFISKNKVIFEDKILFAIIRSSFKPQFEYNMEKVILAMGKPLPFPVFVDPENMFGRLNSISDSDVEIIYLDGNNNIKYVGRPISDPKDEKRFFKRLNTGN